MLQHRLLLGQRFILGAQPLQQHRQRVIVLLQRLQLLQQLLLGAPGDGFLLPQGLDLPRQLFVLLAQLFQLVPQQLVLVDDLGEIFLLSLEEVTLDLNFRHVLPKLLDVLLESFTFLEQVNISILFLSYLTFEFTLLSQLTVHGAFFLLLSALNLPVHVLNQARQINHLDVFGGIALHNFVR
uniref:(northern house mosquito) hypothetical protein n=1 Tax=Culex pipiens TaxID=7175 RepID=A0A8D7ZS72_CULPI